MSMKSMGRRRGLSILRRRPSAAPCAGTRGDPYRAPEFDRTERPAPEEDQAPRDHASGEHDGRGTLRTPPADHQLQQLESSIELDGLPLPAAMRKTVNRFVSLHLRRVHVLAALGTKRAANLIGSVRLIGAKDKSLKSGSRSAFAAGSTWTTPCAMGGGRVGAGARTGRGFAISPRRRSL